MASVRYRERTGVNNSTYHRLVQWVLNLEVLRAVREISQIQSVAEYNHSAGPLENSLGTGFQTLAHISIIISIWKN